VRLGFLIEEAAMPSNESAANRVWGLEKHGIKNVANAYWDLPTPALHEQVVQRREGMIAHLGPLVVRTGSHTGRSPNDKFIVDEPSNHDKIWWGNINRPFDVQAFEHLHHRQLAYLQDKDIFVQDCYAGADPNYRVPIRVVTETAWHSLFARNLFIRELDLEKLSRHQPEFTIINTPRFHAVPELDGTRSDAFIVVHFGRKLVLIGGTSYAGEIKKSVFTVLHYLLPRQHVLSMHCSANYGSDKDDVALFFGLSGTGKTTLSTAPDRTLIGDDEPAVVSLILDAGASGYVLKRTAATDLLPAVEVALRGGTYVSPTLSKRAPAQGDEVETT
jgi:phosphoenolpyruvate carboxykinase (ATP)